MKNLFSLRIGEALKNLRESSNLKQAELAEKIDISRGSVGNYENGTRTLNAESLLKIADFFQVSADFILGRSAGKSNESEVKTMFNLGKKAKDKITGFEGILIGKASYLYGCDQYAITPPARDGKCGDSQWFDVGRIEIIGEGVLAEEVQVEKPGGPNRDCPK